MKVIAQIIARELIDQFSYPIIFYDVGFCKSNEGKQHFQHTLITNYIT